MSKARLIITAVVVEGRTKSEVARDYEVSRYWVQQLVKRWHAEGEAAYQPRSRRPHSSPLAVPAEVEDQIVRLRKDLTRQGLDAGADTIRSHLARRTPRSLPDHRSPAVTAAPDFSGLPSVSTIWRILTRARLRHPAATQATPVVLADRFAAEQPNERWQADITHWQLADGTGVEILNIIDDHSRLALAAMPRRTITGRRHATTRSRTPSCAGNPGQRAHRHSIWVARQSELSCRPAVKDRCRPAPARHRYLTEWSASATPCLLIVLAGGATAGGSRCPVRNPATPPCSVRAR